MSKQNIFFAGVITAAMFTLLYALEGYLGGIFHGAPSVPLRRFAGDYWYLWFIVIHLISGIVFAALYPLLAHGLQGSRGMRGAKYGFGAWVLATLTYPSLIYVNVALPLWLIVGWIVSTLVNLVIAGYIVGLFIDVKE